MTKRQIDHDPHPEIESLRALYQAYQRGNGWPIRPSIPKGDLPALRGLLDDGVSPPDVELCTLWLRSNPFWQARVPPVASVHKNIAEWTRQGRPQQWREISPPRDGRARRRRSGDYAEPTDEEVEALRRTLKALPPEAFGTHGRGNWLPAT